MLSLLLCKFWKHRQKCQLLVISFEGQIGEPDARNYKLFYFRAAWTRKDRDVHNRSELSFWWLDGIICSSKVFSHKFCRFLLFSGGQRRECFIQPNYVIVSSFRFLLRSRLWNWIGTVYERERRSWNQSIPINLRLQIESCSLMNEATTGWKVRHDWVYFFPYLKLKHLSKAHS